MSTRICNQNKRPKGTAKTAQAQKEPRLRFYFVPNDKQAAAGDAERKELEMTYETALDDFIAYLARTAAQEHCRKEQEQ